MDFLKVITIILFILLTIFTIKIHPDIHQPMIIEDENFKLTRISDTITTENLPVTSPAKTASLPQTTTPDNNTAAQTKTIELKNQEPARETKYIQTEPQKIKKREKKVVQQDNRIAKKNIPDETSQLELLQRIIEQAEKEEEAAPVELPKNIKHEQVQQQPQKTHSNPYMTEQEEIIAWNRWRSNLQNQIMRNSQIDYAPLGTLFTFTFVVDKFGNVSNIKVQCSNPNYMEAARNRVKPAIANLQRKPILKFPRGSQRTSTVVIGGFIIGTEERFSTPDQFSDYERITY